MRTTYQDELDRITDAWRMIATRYPDPILAAQGRGRHGVTSIHVRG